MLIRNLIYILQSENYILSRFLKYAYSHPYWWKLERRQKIKWTVKAISIFILTWALILVVLAVYILLFHSRGLLLVVPLVLLLPFIISLSLLIIKPLDILLKKRIINKARSTLSNKKAIIVGITGSYGKTSTKEILSATLGEKFKVIKTSENINTDIGIANFILRKLKDEEVFIVEMGAHYPGDISKICEMIKPQYSILTGINEMHIERFRNIDNIITEKFELPQKTKNISVLNFDDENVRKNYKSFKINNPIGVSREKIKNIKFKDELKGLEFETEGKKFECGLLAEHNVTLILLCVEIAKSLGMSIDEIEKGVRKLKPFSHRLEPIYNSSSDIWVIDDSYNSNKNGIISGIEVLSRARGRRVVLTPGLVELGDKSKLIHNEMGKLYAKSVDLVLLIKTNVSDFIIEGLEKNNFRDYNVYDSTEEAHDDLKNILKAGDTIIFQNDLTDNYF